MFRCNDMFELIDKIQKDSILKINNNKYKVLAKVLYVTETETDNWYAKIQLENHHVLVISPFDDYMYFGYVGDEVNCTFPTPDKLNIDNNIYIKDADYYQIVKEFVFGDYLNMEGEVLYSDYSCNDNIISLGIITRTNKRADVFAKVIDLSNVEII